MVRGLFEMFELSRFQCGGNQQHGIRNKADVESMRKHGVHTFLIGETFMRADDIAAEVAKLF